MRFWDSSALLPLFLPERFTQRAEAWLESDPKVTIWALTRVEVLSAIARRRRAEPETVGLLQIARREAMRSWLNWTEVTDLASVRRHAERIVETHPLRAADALQLGAALVAAEGDPSTLEFVTLDRRLADAAEREGFPVFGPD
ncbi:MAG: type II toxin-antitoxin system VapC family toxin [Candidatus Binatales bacterium]